MRGSQIISVDRLVKLANDKKSVCGIDGLNPKPAAVMIHMQVITVHKWISRGLFEYIPNPKRSIFNNKLIESNF